MVVPKLKARDFSQLKKDGLKIKGRHFIFLYTPASSLQDSGVSFIVSKKHGNAVIRNKQKRWFRSMCQTQYLRYLSLLSQVKLLVVIIPVTATYEKKANDFQVCLDKLYTTLQEKILC